MARYIAALIAAVLAVAPRVPVVALDRSTAQADYAWLIVVDDLHINFTNTGRLRTWLRAAASELVRDGDLVELRTTGPSKPMPLTSDRELLATAVKWSTGNGLKPADYIGTASGSSAWKEALYRANTSLDTARDALSAFSLGDGLRKAIVFVSAGYDMDAFPALADRVAAFARRAREDNITIFAIDARGFGQPLDPRIEPLAWLHYTTAGRRSLAMMAEETGGFVIDDANDPAAGLRRINLQMR